MHAIRLYYQTSNCTEIIDNQVQKEHMQKEDLILPELKLREAADKGAKLFGAARGEGWAVGHPLDLGVHLRRQERDQQLQDVDS